MDEDAENVGETRKYSFLLGSAIRNEDPDQFLSIYDAIIPPHLPDIQIDYIKDKAREIADLPEEDFNHLVLNAREYSLAPDRKMSRTSFGATQSARGVRSAEELSSEEEEELVSSKYSIIPPSASPSDIYDFSNEQSEYLYEKRTDNDSGIYNSTGLSSKATTSIGSFMSDREDDSDAEDRSRGIFDYIPTKPKQRVNTTYKLDYDESHEVEDSDKNSQCDIESPRSDVSYGTEMQTFRLVGKESDDFETSDESEDEKQFSRIPHKRLYNQPRTSNNYYTPMQRESSEDYGNYSTLSFDRSQKALHNRTASSLRGVDETVNFPLSGPRSYGTTVSSDRVRVEKSSYSRYFDSNDPFEHGPPFGHGGDQFRKVASSIEPLIGGQSSQNVSNMPEGRQISIQEGSAEGAKKKKKKKKGSKDDLEVKKSDYDENGNPCLGENSPLLPTPAYRQMRESPNSLHGGTTTKTRYSQNNGFPTKLQQFDSFNLGGQQVKDSEDTTSTNQSSVQDTSSKKRKKLKKETVIRAEDVPNYVGNKEIDEIIKLIENDGGTKKSNTKKVPANDILPTVKPAEKNTKKCKDKRHKPSASTNNVKVNEETCDNSVDNKTAACELVEVVSHKPESLSIETMGNSNARSSTEENGVLTDNDDVEVTIDGDTSDNKMCAVDLKHINKSVKCESKTKNDRILDKTPDDVKPCKKTPPSVVSNKKLEKATVISENNNTDRVKNNVKHNNSKNKVKGESSIDSSKVNAVKQIVNSNNFLSSNDYLIFTDLEIPEKEAEFTVVSKKKKQKTVVANNSATNTAKDSNNVTSGNKDSAQLPLRQPVSRPERPQRHIPRSVTPPPRSSLSTKDSVDVERLRDLSPSSFPALNSAAPSLARDGRRNSTGDVPTELVFKGHDDSDMESVKSLPASQGGCSNQQIVSPRLPVTYAKIAASPKPSNTSLVSAESSPEDWKSTVWKGSLTERRHSIGSSPENTISKDIEPSPVIRQKYGSQEALVNSAIGSNSDQGQANAMVKNGDLCSDKVSKSDSKSNEVRNVGASASAPCVLVNDSIMKQVSSVQQSMSSDLHSQMSVPLPAREVLLPSRETRQEDSAHNAVQEKATLSDRKHNDTKHVPPKQSVNATRKNNKNKSVIFLDKRLNHVPKNLGITFGFELGADINSIGEVDGGGISFFANDVVDPENNSTTFNACPSVIEPHSHEIDSEKSNHSKDSIGQQHSLAGKNGVILPKALTLPAEGESINFMCNDQVSKCNIENCDAEKPNNSLPNLVVVCYGELTNELSPCVGKTESVKKLMFLPEQPVDKGRFNQQEALTYIFKEWDKIRPFSESNSENLVIYNSKEM